MTKGLAARLNDDGHGALVDHATLDQALREQGEDFLLEVRKNRPHLFADAAYFISAAQLEQMRAVIAAVERVVSAPGWLADTSAIVPKALGVFMGYDFHLNADGAHLIEINSNAGGAFLNALLLQSQHDVELPGKAAAEDELEQIFLAMFRREWNLERNEAPLETLAIVDEQPREQYLYPEFVLAQRLFQRAGITAIIVDPAELELRADGLLYGEGRRIDLIYNRLTDFTLAQHPALHSAYFNRRAVVTPHPCTHALYADKRNLARLTDSEFLLGIGVGAETISVLQRGIPQTRAVEGDAERWWSERKQWFFKPAAGFGGKAAYRGDKLTRRVFDEVMQGGYVAQKIAPPGERRLRLEGPEVALKADVRCYVYDGQIQLIAARLYQGQTTNFRTPGGGFAQVRVVD